MRGGPAYRVPFRRRREGRTDYRQRLRLLKSGLPRAVVRRSSRNIQVQIVFFEGKGDRIVVSAISKELGKHGWKHTTGNTPTAYLTGYLAGKKAMKKGINSATLDIGLHAPSKGSKVFACLKGMVDAGMEISHDKSILPSEERIKGKHTKEGLAEDFEVVKTRIEGL